VGFQSFVGWNPTLSTIHRSDPGDWLFWSP